MTTVYIDESYRPEACRSVLSGVIVDDDHADPLRRHLTAMLQADQKRLHWRKSRSAGRRSLTQLVTTIQPRPAVVVVAAQNVTRLRQMAAREDYQALWLDASWSGRASTPWRRLDEVDVALSWWGCAAVKLWVGARILCVDGVVVEVLSASLCGDERGSWRRVG